MTHAPLPTSGPGSGSLGPRPYDDVLPEAEHLRRIIELQPVCLVRVALDGTLLAVNAAALELFGATELSEVLDGNIGQHLVIAASDWEAFAERVWTQGAASIECGLARGERTLTISAVPIPEHADNIDSLIVTLRETSVGRRLEQTLETDAPPGEAGGSGADREQMAGELRRVTGELAALQQRADEQQRALAEKDGLRAAVEAQLADAADVRQRLTSAIDGAEARNRALEEEVARLRAELIAAGLDREQTLALSRRAAAEAEATSARIGELEAGKSLLERQLALAAGERDRLETAAATARARYEAELAEARDQANRDLAREGEALQTLESTLAEALDRSRRFEAVVADRERALQQLDADLREARSALDSGREDARRLVEEACRRGDEMEAQATATQQELDRLVALVGARDAELERAAADRAETDRALAAAREQSRLGQLEAQQLISILESRLSNVETDRRSAATVLTERDADVRRQAEARVIAESNLERALEGLDAARLEVERVTAELQRAEADRDRQAMLLEHERGENATLLAKAEEERLRLSDRCDTLARELEEVRRNSVRTDLNEQTEYRNRVAMIQADLALAIAERKRAETLAADAERKVERALEARSARESEMLRTLRASEAHAEALLKSLADTRLELDQVQVIARMLEPLAVRGRLASSVAEDLGTTATAIQECAAILLRQTALGTNLRPAVESLQSEALRLLSLARIFHDRSVSGNDRGASSAVSAERAGKRSEG